MPFLRAAWFHGRDESDAEKSYIRTEQEAVNERGLQLRLCMKRVRIQIEYVEGEEGLLQQARKLALAVEGARLST